MLKEQRALRRITHPYAAYTKSGKLLCTICRTTIKSENVWTNHLKSPEHNIRKLNAQAQSEERPKKRKADSEDEDEDEGRKRNKGDGVDEAPLSTEEDIVPIGASGDTTEADTPNVSAIQEADSELRKTAMTSDGPVGTASTARTDDDQDAEWLALKQELESSAPGTDASATLHVSATISAAPVSAEELAAQAREEQSTQRDRRHDEIEAEKEDAARALEDEFQEMEELEDRVQRLRQRREALRNAPLSDSAAKDAADSSAVTAPAEPAKGSDVLENGPEDSSDEDDDDDDWAFGGA